MLATLYIRKSQWHNAQSARSFGCLFAASLAWAGIVASDLCQGRTLIVTNLDDGGPGSLRQEIAGAHSGDTISFVVRGTIALKKGELLITNNIRITGPGVTNLAISAQSQSRVLEILPGAALHLYGLTIGDGRAPDGTTGTSNSPTGGNGSDGGGIYNAGRLTMTQCAISDCVAGNGGRGFWAIGYSTPDATNWIGGAGGRGGAIYNSGNLSLRHCNLTFNRSGGGGDGGGIGSGQGPYGGAGGLGGEGGAICNAGSIGLLDCVLDHNAAGKGGNGYAVVWWGVSTPPAAGGPGGNGGGLYDAGPIRTVIRGCQFNFNVSGPGGTGSTAQMSAPDVGGTGGAGGGGGAVWTSGSLLIDRCTFLSNQTSQGAPGGWGISRSGAGGAGGPGGAIFALGELAMARCSYTSNHTGPGGNGSNGYRLGGPGANGGFGGAIFAGSSLRMTDCTFSSNEAGPGGHGGSAQSQDSAIGAGAGGNGGSGGALYCQSDLTATNCMLVSNHAGDAGSPGFAGYNFSITGQPSSSGSSGGQGGGILGLGPLVLFACTISGNLGGNGTSADTSGPQQDFIFYTRAGGAGGPGGTAGIYAEHNLRLILCTLSGNIGGSGGSGGQSYDGWPGAYAYGGPGGTGGAGAGYCSRSNDLTLIACTIAANSGGHGGAGGHGQIGLSGQGGDGVGGTGGAGGVSTGSPMHSATLINTLLGSNRGGTGGAVKPPDDFGPADLQGSFTSLGHNLIGQTNGSSGFTNGVNGDLAGSALAPLDPLLGPLADNGGPTLTMALLHGSPALDAGDDELRRPPYSLRHDQRGFPRKSGSHVDIGAFEFQYSGPDLSTQPPILTLLANDGLQANTVSKGSDAVPPPNFVLTFSDNNPGATFTVLATTNLATPLNKWSAIGQPLRIGPSLLQFIDPQATNSPQRFYRVSSP